MMHTVNLDALEHTEHAVIVKGERYQVRAMTPRVAYLIDGAATADGAAKAVAYYDAVALLVPDMPRTLVDDLNHVQALKIIALANTAVKVVDEAAAVPNVPSSAPNDGPVAEPDEYSVTPLVAC